MRRGKRRKINSLLIRHTYLQSLKSSPSISVSRYLSPSHPSFLPLTFPLIVAVLSLLHFHCLNSLAFSTFVWVLIFLLLSLFLVPHYACHPFSSSMSVPFLPSFPPFTVAPLSFMSSFSSLISHVSVSSLLINFPSVLSSPFLPFIHCYFVLFLLLTNFLC